MKRYILILIILAIGFPGFSQHAFDQATLKELYKEYQKDPNAFFINRLSDDFRYCSAQGKIIRKSEVTIAGNQRIIDSTFAQQMLTTVNDINSMLKELLQHELLDPSVIQSGDLAIVSGWRDSTEVGTNVAGVVGKLFGTYTFQRRKGKWVFLASHETAGSAH